MCYKDQQLFMATHVFTDQEITVPLENQHLHLIIFVIFSSFFVGTWKTDFTTLLFGQCLFHNVLCQKKEASNLGAVVTWREQISLFLESGVCKLELCYMLPL